MAAARLALRVAQATTYDALAAVVLSVARATDNLREEMADNTASVDAVCAELDDIKKMLQRIVAKVGA